MVVMLRQALLVIACLALIVVPQCFASGISSAGLSLAAANTWTAAQTFPEDGVKIADASGDLLTLSAGTQSANRKLSAPALSGDDTVATLGTVQTFSGSKTFTGDLNAGSPGGFIRFNQEVYMLNNKPLYFYNTGSTLYTKIAIAAPSASYTLTIPALTGNGTVRVATATSAGTATLVAGTVTVSNTSITANSRIHLTAQNESGTAGHLGVSARSVGTSFTIKSYQGDGTAQTSDTRLVYWTSEEP